MGLHGPPGPCGDGFTTPVPGGIAQVAKRGTHGLRSCSGSQRHVNRREMESKAHFWSSKRANKLFSQCGGGENSESGKFHKPQTTARQGKGYVEPDGWAGKGKIQGRLESRMMLSTCSWSRTLDVHRCGQEFATRGDATALSQLPDSTAEDGPEERNRVSNALLPLGILACPKTCL
jgi:hypothetical protein